MRFSSKKNEDTNNNTSFGIWRYWRSYLLLFLSLTVGPRLCVYLYIFVYKFIFLFFLTNYVVNDIIFDCGKFNFPMFKLLETESLINKYSSYTNIVFYYIVYSVKILALIDVSILLVAQSLDFNILDFNINSINNIFNTFYIKVVSLLSIFLNILIFIKNIFKTIIINTLGDINLYYSKLRFFLVNIEFTINNNTIVTLKRCMSHTLLFIQKLQIINCFWVITSILWLITQISLIYIYTFNKKNNIIFKKII